MVTPGDPTTAKVEEIGDPPDTDGAILVEGLLVGVCGTDVEIVEKGYGIPPAGHERMVLFHESLGRIPGPLGKIQSVQRCAEMLVDSS